MELMQTFSDPPSAVMENLVEYFEPGNGSYYRWDPRPTGMKYFQERFGHDAFSEVNQWLFVEGLTIDDSKKYFNVLILLDW